MAGIAALKAHLVKTSGFNPQRRGIVADISLEASAIHSIRGRFCCYYSDYGSYMLFPSPLDFYALLMSVVCVTNYNSAKPDSC